MATKSKTLSIPCIPELDGQDLETVAKILDEKGTRRPIDTLNWKEQYPYRPLTSFSMAHSGTHIYVEFFVRCNYLRAVNYTNNSPVHQDSCVEFFVSPKDRVPYYNFEMNCIGTLHAACRTDRHNGTPLTDEQLAKVRRYASCGNRPFNELEGMFSWSIVMAIPLDLIGLEYKGKPVTIYGNLYKCADLTSSPHFLSWSPIDTPEPDFHRPEFFGKITLE